MSEELWILSLLVDGADPLWDQRATVIGSPEKLAAMYDPKHLPYGAILLKGKQAKRFLKQVMKDEIKYQKQEAMKTNMRNN